HAGVVDELERRPARLVAAGAGAEVGDLFAVEPEGDRPVGFAGRVEPDAVFDALPPPGRGRLLLARAEHVAPVAAVARAVHPVPVGVEVPDARRRVAPAV